MQSKSVAEILIKSSLIFTLLVVLFSCEKENTPRKQIKCKNNGTPATSPYDLDVSLRGEDKKGSGYIVFRQDADAAKIITLNISVRKMQQDRAYLLQRAVDTDLDGNCTGTEWLTLGKGLQSESILTDRKGDGYAELWRNVSTIPSASIFDIHFRVVDAVNSAVVLTSDCYQYTVR